MRDAQFLRIFISPKQSRFGNGLEDTMSFKLTFHVRFGRWRLALSIGR
ncbi:hypothetical protein X727_15680 [Mesorhizobium sp. L103C119B0]|nr:hypothetical protein X727_15680 [Mesorhizobium sp. L103C119B0]